MYLINLEERIADDSQWPVVSELWQSEYIDAPFTDGSHHLRQSRHHMSVSNVLLTCLREAVSDILEICHSVCEQNSQKAVDCLLQTIHYCSPFWALLPSPQQKLQIAQLSFCRAHQVYVSSRRKNSKLECGPMPNVVVALPNIGGAFCSMLQFGWRPLLDVVQ